MEYTQEQIKEFGIQFTPPDLALAICGLIKSNYDTAGVLSRPEAQILEPSAGQGAFVQAARQTWPGAWIDAVEIFDERAMLEKAGASSVLIVDFLTSPIDDDDPFSATKGVSAGFKLSDSAIGYDLCVGNPPFRKAEQFVRKGISLLRAADREVHEIRSGLPTGCKTLVPAPMIHAFLLNMTFEGTAERVDFWREHSNWTSHVIIPRPPFSGGKTSDRMEYKLFVWHPGGKGSAGEPLIWREPKRRGIVGTLTDLVNKRGRKKNGPTATTTSLQPSVTPIPPHQAVDKPATVKTHTQTCDDPW